MGKEASQEFLKVLQQIKQFSGSFEEAVDIYTTNSAENFNSEDRGDKAEAWRILSIS